MHFLIMPAGAYASCACTMLLAAHIPGNLSTSRAEYFADTLNGAFIYYTYPEGTLYAKSAAGLCQGLWLSWQAWSSAAALALGVAVCKDAYHSHCISCSAWDGDWVLEDQDGYHCGQHSLGAAQNLRRRISVS